MTKKNKATLDKFVQVPNNVWHSRDLSDGELRTYMAIRSHRNDNDPLGTFPSRDRIKFMANKKSLSTVSRHIEKLIEKGFIGVKYRYNDSTIYNFPSEGKSCNCKHECRRDTTKFDVYWNYCIDNIETLKLKEAELSDYYEKIYRKEPSVDNLLKFIEDIEVAKAVKEEE